MGALFVHVLKSAICLAVFYLFYRALLSKETFHRFNRVALLSILALSFVVPSIHWKGMVQTQANQAMAVMEDFFITALPTEVAEEADFSWQGALVVAYLLGVIFFLMKQLISLGSMYRLIRCGKKEEMDEGVTLVTHQRPIGPFSWMHYIVISENDLAENAEAILLHERAHIRNRHSWDVLWVDLCIAVQWFNPAVWLVKRELQDIHEYEADASVIKQGVDAKKYQLLLIKKAVGTRLYSMANSFNHSSLKKRITMMLKKKSNPWARMKFLYVLPMAAIAVAAFARPEVSSELNEISSVKVSDFVADIKAQNEKKLSDTDEKIVPQDSVKDETFSVVENPPQFPGGMKELMNFLGENIQYPAEAHENNIQGRVIVQFVVKKDGSISDLKVVRSVHPLLDAEALRVLKTMPKWIPGMQRGKAVNVKYIVPVGFKLQGNKQKAAGEKLDSSRQQMYTYDSSTDITCVVKDVQQFMSFVTKKGDGTAFVNPLILLDGKEISESSSELKNLESENVECIRILSGAAQTAEYGEKGKRGVILIKTKK